MRKTAKMLRNGHFFLFIDCFSFDLSYFLSSFAGFLLAYHTYVLPITHMVFNAFTGKLAPNKSFYVEILSPC
ncbi:MAG TPA: hypothetical protein PLV28_01650, partial [Bacilli bacterium]|nr:hypothetical protein [Bacilli bacterium]